MTKTTGGRMKMVFRQIGMALTEWRLVDDWRREQAEASGIPVSTSAALRALVLRGLAAGGTP
ncbi:MAG: hypothetical protein ACI9K2_006639 [Myxococcota bacterium]|jgi:hypothetical protein